jgi:multidrug resistance efflux pump
MSFTSFLKSAEWSDRSLWPAGVGLALLGAWSLWLVFGRVSVYAVSTSGRLEVDSAPYQVDAPVEGRVVRSPVVLGQTVAAGALLVELDAKAEALALARERTRIASLEPQIDALALRLTEGEDAAQAQVLVVRATRDEAVARRRASRSAAALKRVETAKLDELVGREAVAAFDADRTRSEAQQRRADADAADGALRRVTGQEAIRRSDRLAELARLQQERAELLGRLRDVQDRVRELEYQLSLRTIRAPVSGRIGFLATLREGAVLSGGTRVAVIVPAGKLRAVASFDPSEVGRIRVGQRTLLRFPSFPWISYGGIVGRVTGIASEPGSVGIRVEVEVVADQRTAIPLQHGLVAEAEVETDRLSPARLLLYTAGLHIHVPTPDSGPR